MPLDSTNWKLPAAKTGPDPVLQEGLAGLAQLSEALRHPEWWGNRITFDYTITLRGPANDCGTAGCALGVGIMLWPGQENWFWGGSHAIGPRFGLSKDEAADLFFGYSSGETYGCFMANVTPTMVADAIDRLLAEKGFEG